MDAIRAHLEEYSVVDAVWTPKQRDHNLKEQLAVVQRLLQLQPQDVITHIGALLTSLDPAKDTIPYVSFLQRALEQVKLPPGVTRQFILDRTLEFLLEFNPYHIRYAGKAFAALLDYVLSGRAFTPLVSVEAVASALSRLDPTRSMFTSIHLPLARLAYDKGHIKSVLPVLNGDIICYPGISGKKDAQNLSEENLAPNLYISTDTGLTQAVKYSEILEYNLVAGLCYTSVENWSKAHSAFERVLSHPSKEKGVSEIMVAAFKRWLLVGLLKNGQESKIPLYTSSAAIHVYNSLVLPYQNIGTEFVGGNVAQLRTEIETHRGIWEADGTTLLIDKVAAAYQRWQIVNLRKVYQQVSIAQVRKTTVSGETGKALETDEQALTLIRDMMASKMLKGKIHLGNTGEDSYLEFLDDEVWANEAEFARRVALCHRSIKSLGEQYRVANERLSSNKDYIRSVIRDQKRAEKEASEAAGFESQVEDEDLMTGIMTHA